MQAIVRERYGSPEVVRLVELDTPVPAEGQVLVRVHAASVNPLDWHELTGAPYLVRLSGGLRSPKADRLGTDLAGVVTAVGPGVTGFAPGDEVYGARDGAFAEYVCVREAGTLTHKPAGVSFAQAAAVPVAALTALQALRDRGGLQAGQQVLINGAAGGVGTFAVQIAKALGAEVTAVCSTRNVEQTRSLGADHVIDYTQRDFTRAGQAYHLVLDNVGTRSVRDRRRVLRPGGMLVAVGGPKANRWVDPVPALLWMMVASRFGHGRMVPMLAKLRTDDLVTLAKMMTAGTVTPVIDRTFPLADTAEALAYVGTGHARAKVVVTV
jgi:NADPH:quinone reductase-like Zn-dependent oxidoreductase